MTDRFTLRPNDINELTVFEFDLYANAIDRLMAEHTRE